MPAIREGEFIDDMEAVPLSDKDIRRIAGPESVILSYPSLANYSSIVSSAVKGIALLYPQTPTWGHWVAVTMTPHNKTLYYFDSYGKPIDHYLKDGYTHYLSNLIDHAMQQNLIKRVITNTKKLQSEKDGIASCGRYAALRLIFRSLSNDEFIALISDVRGGGSVTDRNVSLLTALATI